MKTTVDIADDLLRRAKAQARDEQKTLRQFLEEALRAALAKRAQHRKAFRLADGSVDGEGLQPGVDAARLVDAAYEDRLA